MVKIKVASFFVSIEPDLKIVLQLRWVTMNRPDVYVTRTIFELNRILDQNPETAFYVEYARNS